MRDMHEFSIAESILDVIEQEIGSVTPVSAVHLRVGRLSGVCADALEFCFPEVAEQRGFGKPTLTIESPPADVHCRDCGADYGCEDFYEGCPHCASLNREIRSGHECNVDWIQIEED